MEFLGKSFNVAAIPRSQPWCPSAQSGFHSQMLLYMFSKASIDRVLSTFSAFEVVLRAEDLRL